MAIEFKISQVIDYPQDLLFLFLSDLENMVLWNYYIDSIDKTTEEKGKIGTIYRQVRPHDILYYKITEFNPPQKIMVELKHPNLKQKYGFVLERKGQKTSVAYTWQVDFTKYKLLKYIPKSRLKKWILSRIERHIMRKIKPATEQNFSKLKTLLEETQVILQNGKKMNLPSRFIKKHN